MINKTINKLFDFIPETNIIEEYAYNNKGFSPVYSGQTEKEGIVAYINKNKQEGPCLTFTTYGINAGKLSYRDGKYTIGRNCMGLIPKDEYKDKINLEWFSYKYQNLFYRHRIGDISGQRSLNKKLLENVKVVIPDDKIQKEQLEVYKKIKSMIDKINELIKHCNDLLKCKGFITDYLYKDTISNIFHIYNGNNNLTEEFIYNNEPTNKTEQIKILSSATLETNMMGYISRNAEYEGKKIKIFKAPCLLVARNGYAGKITYIDNEEFTTNDHAYVLVPKKKWMKLINLRWFAFQYQELFYNLTTSKSDNATFNKSYAQKQEIEIPKIEIQNNTAKCLNKIDNLLLKLKSERKRLINLIEYEL